jgi:Ribosomal L38e protein family
VIARMNFVIKLLSGYSPRNNPFTTRLTIVAPIDSWTDVENGLYCENGSRQVRQMPAEITKLDEFIQLSETAHECRVKRAQDTVKLKLRTPNRLYTFKTKVDRADEVIKRLKCEIVEV